jgi:hypothetical protein
MHTDAFATFTRTADNSKSGMEKEWHRMGTWTLLSGYQIVVQERERVTVMLLSAFMSGSWANGKSNLPALSCFMGRQIRERVSTVPTARNYQYETAGAHDKEEIRIFCLVHVLAVFAHSLTCHPHHNLSIESRWACPCDFCSRLSHLTPLHFSS